MDRLPVKDFLGQYIAKQQIGMKTVMMSGHKSV